MSRMIFDLTDEDRELLEKHRVRLGLRSHAETLRQLIRGRDGDLVRATPDAPKPSFSHGRSKTVVARASNACAAVRAEDVQSAPEGWEGEAMSRPAADPEIMAAQAAYFERGMTGPSPDRDLVLIPEAVRGDMLAGFAFGRWTPTKDEMLTLDYEGLLARQRG